MGTKYKQNGRRFSHDDRFEGPLSMVQITVFCKYYASLFASNFKKFDQRSKVESYLEWKEEYFVRISQILVPTFWKFGSKRIGRFERNKMGL